MKNTNRHQGKRRTVREVDGLTGRIDQARVTARAALVDVVAAARREGWGEREIAAALGISRATFYRHYGPRQVAW